MKLFKRILARIRCILDSEEYTKHYCTNDCIFVVITNNIGKEVKCMCIEWVIKGAYTDIERKIEQATIIIESAEKTIKNRTKEKDELLDTLKELEKIANTYGMILNNC